jgi:proteasome activator subunit 4
VPTGELSLDWRPLYEDLYRYFIRVNADPPVNDSLGKSKDLNHLTRLARHAQKYFPASEIPAILEKILPEVTVASPPILLTRQFEAYFLTGAFNTIGLLTLLIPLQFPAEENPPPESLIQTYLPLMFSLWSQVTNSSQWNFLFIDLFGVIASRQISSPHAKFGHYGIFTREQSIHTISCVFRLLGVPIGPVGAGAYSRDVLTPDHCTIVRYRGTRTGDELCIGTARWIVYSMTNEVMNDVPGSGEMTSMWGMVESLLQSVETAFHPSNSGNWTPKLAALVYRLAEKFTHRWTQEQRGKRPDVPEERRLTPALKRRFVLALRKVVFMSIYDKNSQASCIPRPYYTNI